MARPNRRALLRLAAGLLATAALPRPVRAAVEAPDPVLSEVIGFSQLGRPLVVHRLGRGRRRVLLLGGQHGWPEANTVALVDLLLAHFAWRQPALPPGVGLDVLSPANPDGYLGGSRFFASGVDPNRNWGGPDWSPDAWDSNGAFGRGLGGPAPFSEPETHALALWVLRERPVLVLNYHSAGGFLLADPDNWNGRAAQIYGTASGYWWPEPDLDPFGYPIGGSMDIWLRLVGIANLFLELHTHADPEPEAHLAGLVATLAAFPSPRKRRARK
jgi:hypothetical protein